MLTVKHVEPTGHETIHEATDVSSAPADRFGEAVNRVFYTRANSEVEGITSGTVYVMNEAGKTVAVYRLGGWNEPATAA